MSRSVIQISTAILILFVLILLNGFGALSPALDAGRLGMSFLTKPLAAVLGWVRDLAKVFLSVRDLVSQNKFLTQQIETLNTTLARYETANEENRVLREALGFQAGTKLELKAAEILGYDYLNFDEKAILNRGSRDGVNEGDNVIAAPASSALGGAGTGILIGVVSEVLDRTSKLELITASGMAVNVRTASGKASGIVSGEHGLGLILEQVSLTEELKPEDRVVTSGLGGKFIPNLFVGSISEVKTKVSDLFQTATVLPGTDFRKLQIVFIIKNQ